MARKAKPSTDETAQETVGTPMIAEEMHPAESTEDSLDLAEGEAKAEVQQAASTEDAPREQGAEENHPVVATAPDEAALAGTEIVVTCRNPGSRRRAGRRWPEGETRLPAGTLSDFDLQVLRADPMFSVEG